MSEKRRLALRIESRLNKFPEENRPLSVSKSKSAIGEDEILQSPVVLHTCYVAKVTGATKP